MHFPWLSLRLCVCLGNMHDMACRVQQQLSTAGFPETLLHIIGQLKSFQTCRYQSPLWDCAPLTDATYIHKKRYQPILYACRCYAIIHALFARGFGICQLVCVKPCIQVHFLALLTSMQPAYVRTSLQAVTR